MQPRFLDTNVLLRHLARDDEDKARRALALLVRVETGQERVTISPIVVFETIYTLQRSYHVPREEIRRLLSDVISLAGIQLSGKDLYYRALDIYAQKKISFGDAYNIAYMEKLGISEVYSWDADFDRFDHVTRYEPEEGEQAI